VRDFLDRVAAHLGPVPDDERRELLTDLESHIHEALETRLSGRKPTLEDLQAVLAEMDPPESYGESLQTDKPTPAVKTGLAIASLCTSWASFLSALLVLLLYQGRDVPVAFVLLLAGPITALVLGMFSRPSPLRKAAVITSLVLITMMVPFAFLLLVVYVVVRKIKRQPLFDFLR
jgi:hypothetical protein